MNTLKQIQVKIDSILGGRSPIWHYGGRSQFLHSIAIDPELPSGSLIKGSGVIMPTRMQNAIGTSGLGSAAPMWISSAQTTTGIFVYANSGSVYTLTGLTIVADQEGGFDKAKTTGSDLGTGNGMVYYNDYMYFSTQDDISRMGRLSTTAPVFTNNYWVSTLGQTSLSSSVAYPSTRSVTYPSHVLHVHNDGNVYIADYADGHGRIHRFRTDNTGANPGQEYNVLTLPPGMMPTDFESYGTDLAILAIPEASYASGSIPRPGNSAMYLWDTVQSRFYRAVPIREVLATCLLSKNGQLYVVAGNLDTRVILLKYLGGESFETLIDLKEGTPPPAGAADVVGNMLMFGVYGTEASTFAGVMSHGYRSGGLPGGAVNNIARITDVTNTLPIVSALKAIQSGTSGNYPLVGWRTDTSAAYGLDRYGGSGSYASVFRSEVFNIGQDFRIRRIRIPLTVAVTSGITIIPKIYLDDEVSSAELRTINTTNYASSERIIDMQDVDVRGYSNFYIEFQFTGTTEVGIVPPVLIDLDIND